jgi:glycosyltransferase involved in cell wall biosynthesis
VPHSPVQPQPPARALWITWERHRRSQQLSRYLGIELFEVVRKGPRYLRHPSAAWDTLRILRRRRPRAIVVQNPSVFLALLSVLVQPLFRYRLIIDAHNGAIRPEGPRANVLLRLQRWIQRHADATIVPNSGLATDVLASRGRPFILPDRIPDPPVGVERTARRDGRSILLICTFGKDEPVQEFLEAVSDLPPDTTVFITGSESSLRSPLRAAATPSIVFTGWLPDLEYWRLLASVDVVVDLTTREDCLVCGAYEAVAVGQPLILSDTAALRNYFRRGVVFTGNEPEAISVAITDALGRRDELRAEMAAFQPELQRDWARLGEEFVALVGCDGVTQ